MADNGNAPAGIALEAVGIRCRFGRFIALDGVSLHVPQDQITGLIGPNGAGKTTLFNALSGLTRYEEGIVRLFGDDISDLPPHRIAQGGMIRTFQLSRELGRLTVLENLLLTPLYQPGEKFSGIFLTPAKSRSVERINYERACDVLETVALFDLKDRYAAELSGGQKKLLELGRALMGNPRLILLDEPGAGVNPALMSKLCETIAEINQKLKITILVVEHDMNMISRLCDYVVVMAQGRNLAEGTYDEVVSQQRVAEAYLGQIDL